MHHIKAAVTSQNGKHRLGRGFSPDEIKEAGLSDADVRSLAVPIDRKRHTSHEENIECLKAHLEKLPAKPAAKPAAKNKKKPKN
jgi:ribosomal protein L13E